MKKTIISTLFALLSLTGSADGYSFRNLQVEDGLSQSMVYTMMQDDLGFMWFGTGDGLNRYDGEEFRVFRTVPGDSTSVGANCAISMLQLPEGNILFGTNDGLYVYDSHSESFARFKGVDGVVRDLQLDPLGNLWIVSSSGGVFCEDLSARYTNNDSNRTTGRDIGDSGASKRFRVEGGTVLDYRAIAFDDDGFAWISTFGSGIVRLNPHSGAMDVVNISSKGGSNDVTSILPLGNGRLLVGTTAYGVLLYDSSSKTFSDFLSLGPMFVRRLFKDSSGKIWICTETGIAVYDGAAVTRLRYNGADPFSLSDNAIHSICEDRDGGIWVGTYFGGVNFCSLNDPFDKYYPIAGVNSISGRSISEMCEDDHGGLWIGTEDGGLNRMDLASGKFSHGFVPAYNIHALTFDGSKVWVGTYASGLYTYDVSRGTTRRVYLPGQDKGSLMASSIYAIFKDSRSEMWVGSLKGLYRDRGTGVFERVFEQMISSEVGNICEDSSGNLWFTVAGRKVLSYNPEKDKWTKRASLPDEHRIICLTPDKNGNIWFGTDGGGFFRTGGAAEGPDLVVTTDDGLLNNTVYSLVAIEDGTIWGGTNRGLFHFDPNTGEISNCTHSDGLITDQFSYKSGLLASDGRLFFGSIKGLVAFRSQDFNTSLKEPSVVFKSISVNGNEVRPGEGKHPIIKESVVYAPKVVIPGKANTFTIGFSNMTYESASGHTYHYMLKGHDRTYVDSRGSGRVTYSGIAPGRYTFVVKSVGRHGKEGPESHLSIVVRAPFLLSLPMMILYMLLAVSLLVFIVFTRFRQLALRRNAARAEFEANKDKELYKAKIDFFTNIAHEIRTPLSLIKMPLDAVMENSTPDDPDSENLNTISVNTERLLSLVNELMDFRKMEASGIKVNFVHCDIVKVVESVVSRFKPSANMQGKAMAMEMPVSFMADVDKELFTKIVSNLLSNAIKHCRKLIVLRFTTDGEFFDINVSNDGDVIAAAYREKIFQPFFKIDENSTGSGIGLPFSRSLAQMHSGSLDFCDTHDGLTTFKLHLPVKQEMVISLSEPEQEPDKKKDAVRDIDKVLNVNRRKRVLVVEDNVEFRSFLVTNLEREYEVLQAKNGVDALKILNSEDVDAVVSDIMMPEMDGMEFCRNVRSDAHICHLPFIMLTAKTTLQSKLEGLENGADAYIEKPFPMDLLRVNISNLLENRTRIIEAFKRNPDATLFSVAGNRSDEKFLNDIADVIHSHLDDTELDVDSLAQAMNMSRATLYRKLRSITEQTPNDFIRLIRLKKAAELLKGDKYRVNEISYIVGFKSSSYFTKCFYNQFGVLPKDFRKGEGR